MDQQDINVAEVVHNCRVSEQFFDLLIGLNYPIELISPSSLP